MPASRAKKSDEPADYPRSGDQAGPDYEFPSAGRPYAGPSFLKELIGNRDVHLSEALPALHHSRAGIIASGTATVESCFMGTPS